MAEGLEHLVDGDPANTVAAWGLLAAVGLVVAYDLVTGGYRGAVLGLAVAAAAAAPALAYRSPHRMLPAEVIGLALVALIVRELFPVSHAEFVGTYLVIATIGLVLAVAVHLYTAVELTQSFAAGFVAMVTMTAATLWTLSGWAADVVFGTTFIESNYALMIELLVATVAGIGAGLLFEGYFRWSPGPATGHEAAEPADGHARPADDAAAPIRRRRLRLADRLALSADRQRNLVRLLQVGLVGVIGIGVVELDLAVVLTGGIALGITFVPAVLRRDYRVPMDVGHALWITSAVFLHAIGTLYLYDRTFWWHNVTHALSGSIVAGIGYATFQAIDEHTGWLQLPPRFMFVLIILFTVSVGVLWELLEFATDQLWLALGRDGDVVAQYSLDDTATDMVFNVVGAVVVAIWGTPYLDALARRGRELVLER